MKTIIAAVLAFVLLASLIGLSAGDDPPTTTTVEIDRTVDGQNVDYWRARSKRFGRLAYARHKWTQAIWRSARYRGTITEALNLACAVYGNCSTLWRKARCESVNFTDFYNEGSQASGIGQFLPSTWRSTPFHAFSPFSPYANALAMGWMHVNGRGGEWVCQ